MQNATNDRSKPIISVRVSRQQREIIERLVSETGIEKADFLRLVVARGINGIEDVVKPAPMPKDEALPA